jgi:hypothetical protein
LRPPILKPSVEVVRSANNEPLANNFTQELVSRERESAK